jgi:hypothetical protein
MSITSQIAVWLRQRRSLTRKKESTMSEQQSINPAAAAEPHDVSPLESFANETAPASSAAPALTEGSVAGAEVTATTEERVPADTAAQPAADDPLATTPASTDAAPAVLPAQNAEEKTSPAAAALDAGVKDFVQAFTFVEHGVSQLGEAAKAELITLARKYL